MTFEAALPTGLAVGEVRFREASVRPLAAEDELLLLDAEKSLAAAESVTMLLSRCVTRIGDRAPLSAEDARGLTVGDREALLLHIRRATFGERLQCVIRCGRPECGAPMDLDLDVAALLVPERASDDEVHEVTLGGRTLRFRLPTGTDQEAVAPIAAHNAPLAAELLLARCIVDGGPVAAAERAELALHFVRLDPQAEITLSLTCPECGGELVSLFDAATFVIREAAAAARELLREVHLLAMVYHWSEREILTMSDRKRRLYLALIAESQGRGRRP